MAIMSGRRVDNILVMSTNHVLSVVFGDKIILKKSAGLLWFRSILLPRDSAFRSFTPSQPSVPKIFWGVLTHGIFVSLSKPNAKHKGFPLRNLLSDCYGKRERGLGLGCILTNNPIHDG